MEDLPGNRDRPCRASMAVHGADSWSSMPSLPEGKFDNDMTLFRASMNGGRGNPQLSLPAARRPGRPGHHGCQGQ